MRRDLTWLVAAALIAFGITKAHAQSVPGIDLLAIQKTCTAIPNQCSQAIDAALEQLRILRQTGQLTAAQESTVLAALSAIVIDTVAGAPPVLAEPLADSLERLAAAADQPNLIQIAEQIRQGLSPSTGDISEVFASAN